MKRITTIILFACTLSSALCRAESGAITHDFDDMVSKSELTFPNRPGSFAVGVTADGITYTCSGDGTFANIGGTIGITLPNNGVVQTSPAIEYLTLIQLIHTKGSTPSGVKISISEDNSNWTEVTATPGPTDIDAALPTKGNYYIQVVNKTGASISFTTFKYIYEPCHCLRVVSE